MSKIPIYMLCPMDGDVHIDEFVIDEGIRHHAGKKQQGVELQGTPYDDTPGKVVDKDNLFMGECYPCFMFQLMLYPQPCYP